MTHRAPVVACKKVAQNQASQNPWMDIQARGLSPTASWGAADNSGQLKGARVCFPWYSHREATNVSRQW